MWDMDDFMDTAKPVPVFAVVRDGAGRLCDEACLFLSAAKPGKPFCKLFHQFLLVKEADGVPRNIYRCQWCREAEVK